MSQKGLAPILIIILIALAAGGYLIYQKQTKLVNVSQPSPPSVASSSAEIATWEQFTNITGRYSFRFPQISSLIFEIN